MVNRRFLKNGSVVVVHRYAEARIPYAKPKVGHGAPYEVHFLSRASPDVRGRSRTAVIWLDLVIIALGVALARGCPASGLTGIEERPEPVAVTKNPGEQPVALSEPAKPAPRAESQPAPVAPLVDPLHELAKDWNLDEPVARIERALEVKLSGDEQRWSGTSTRWPVVVTYHPKRADRRGTLHLSFTNVTSTDFAELTRRFGSPTTQVKAKESRVEFDGPSGTRIVAGLLGGLAPTSKVAWIRVEGPGPRPAPPKDLF